MMTCLQEIHDQCGCLPRAWPRLTYEEQVMEAEIREAALSGDFSEFRRLTIGSPIP